MRSGGDDEFYGSTIPTRNFFSFLPHLADQGLFRTQQRHHRRRNDVGAGRPFSGSGLAGISSQLEWDRSRVIGEPDLERTSWAICARELGGHQWHSRFRRAGLSTQRNPAFLNQALTGTLVLSGDGRGSNDYTVTTGHIAADDVPLTRLI